MLHTELVAITNPPADGIAEGFESPQSVQGEMIKNVQFRQLVNRFAQNYFALFTRISLVTLWLRHRQGGYVIATNTEHAKILNQGKFGCEVAR